MKLSQAKAISAFLSIPCTWFFVATTLLRGQETDPQVVPASYQVARKQLQLVTKARHLLEDRLSVGCLSVQGGQSCGVYAACRAVELAGGAAAAKDFFNTSFISSPAGSSSQELLALLERCQVSGTALANMSHVDLIALGLPVIINVRQNADDHTYSHWICVLFARGQYWAYDGPNTGVAIALGDLQGIWNGFGIVVGSPPYFVFMVLWTTRLMLLAGLLAIGISAWRITNPWHSTSYGRLISIATVVAAAAFMGFIVFEDIQQPYASLKAAAGFDNYEIAEVDAEELRKASRGERWLLLDSRYYDTYMSGAIGSAFNIPVDTTLINLREILADIDRETPILIYCHSARCPFDTMLGAKIRQLGFTNVTASKIGWVEYSAKL